MAKSPLSKLPSPAPVFDTSDLVAIATLPDLFEHEGEREARNIFADTPRKLYNLLNDRSRYRAWLAEARVLAANGVQPGPSHYRIESKDYPVWSGAFQDESSIPRAYPSDPLVIFGVHISHDLLTDSNLPYLPPGYPWQAVTVQSAGIACHHPRFIGIPLTVKRSALGTVYRLASFADLNRHVCISAFSHTLSILSSYAKELESLGLSADGPFTHLEEAVYPLDPSCAHSLSSTPVPEVSDLFAPMPEGHSIKDVMSSLHSFDNTSWGVYVLGENCD